MQKELNSIVRLIRWNGHEIRYNEDEVDFVHEMLAHNLGFKNANLIEMNQCGRSSWQCVIVELDKEKADDLEYLQMVADNATAIQNCFLVEMPRKEYEDLLKARKKRKNNTYDLHMGLYESSGIA